MVRSMTRTASSAPRNVDAVAFNEPLLVASIVAVSMAMGLLVPGLAKALAPLLLPSLFVIVLTSLIPFRSVLLKALLRLERGNLIVVGWLQGLLPCVVFALAHVLGVPDTILPFVLLSACSGAVFATPTLATLFGFDRERAARIMILSTLVMPVSLCLFVGPLIGLDNVQAFQTFGMRVVVFLIVPAMLVGLLRAGEVLLCRARARRAAKDMAAEGAQVSSAEAQGTEAQAPAAREADPAACEVTQAMDHQGWFDVQAVRVGMLALAVFAVSIMDGVAEHAARDPQFIFALFMGGLTVNLGMMLATRFALSPLGADVAHTASIVAMTRNVGLAYAMTAAFFGPTLAEYVALCQVPLLIGPLIARLRASRVGSTGTPPMAAPVPA